MSDLLVNNVKHCGCMATTRSGNPRQLRFDECYTCNRIPCPRGCGKMIGGYCLAVVRNHVNGPRCKQRRRQLRRLKEQAQDLLSTPQ